MIVVSDCLKDKADEGCIKVASTLAKKLKDMGNYIISTREQTSFSDEAAKCNKFFSNRELYKAISKGEGNILYIPFSSNTLGSAVRILFLTKKSGKKVNALFTLCWQMNGFVKLLLRLSKCNIVTLSKESFVYYTQELPQNKCFNVYTGVDSKKFVPVDDEQKIELRDKYGIPLNKRVVLHAGHLKKERNIEAFLEMPEEYYAILVFSSVTEKDKELRERLAAKDNIKIIEEYLSNIEEIFQLSDVYVFPVEAENNSIDVPLSVLEAAGCNLKILSTPYKEIKHFEKVKGLCVRDYSELFWDSIGELCNSEDSDTRKIAEKYDWDSSVKILMEFVD